LAEVTSFFAIVGIYTNWLGSRQIESCSSLSLREILPRRRDRIQFEPKSLQQTVFYPTVWGVSFAGA
jgi:hypothetical protein